MKKTIISISILLVIVLTMLCSCSNDIQKENQGIGRYQPIGEFSVLDTKTGIIYHRMYDNSPEIIDFIYKHQIK